MTTTAALAIEPTIRATGGNDRPASKDAGGDSFAKVLDAELEATTENVPSAQPAPATASQAPVEPVATVSDTATAANGSSDAFKAALALVMAPEQANPAPAATPTADVGQTPGVTALLAAISGAVPADGNGQAVVGDGETTEDASTDGEESAVVILAGLGTPAATPATATATATTLVATETSDKATAPVGQAGAAPLAPEGGETSTAQTADTSANQAQAPEAREQRPPTGSQAIAQPNTQAQPSAAAATDAVAKEAAAASSAAPPMPAANPARIATQAPTDAARVPATPPALQSAPAATVQVYTRIIERADGRAHRFEVRLDPAELGRVDVRIEIGADRKVHAVLAAHDSAALSDLVRGQRALERALSGAGIDLAENGVRFELASDSGRGSASQQQTNDGNGRSSQSNVWRNFDAVAIPVSEETAAATVKNTWRPQRLDLVA